MKWKTEKQKYQFKSFVRPIKGNEFKLAFLYTLLYACLPTDRRSSEAEAEQDPAPEHLITCTALNIQCDRMKMKSYAQTIIN